jgi:hypothetical protein
MAYTLGEAANAVGKAKSTIFKAIKDGVISAARDDRGRFVIEPAELHRIFPPISAERPAEQPAEQPRTDEEALKTGIERDFLKREIEQLRSMLDDMKAERDEWRKQAQTLAIADQSKPARSSVPVIAPAKPRSWWKRLAG